MAREERTKECFKCHKVKPLSEFYKHKGMKDGHLNKCRACTVLEAQRSREHCKEVRRLKKAQE